MAGNTATFVYVEQCFTSGPPTWASTFSEACLNGTRQVWASTPLAPSGTNQTLATTLFQSTTTCPRPPRYLPKPPNDASVHRSYPDKVDGQTNVLDPSARLDGGRRLPLLARLFRRS